MYRNYTNNGNILNSGNTLNSGNIINSGNVVNNTFSSGGILNSGINSGSVINYMSPAPLISQKEINFLKPNFIENENNYDIDIHQVNKFIKMDHGLADRKKHELFTVINTPEIFDHMLAGTAGALLTTTIARFANMSQTAQTLLGLAGFGLGNIMYNILQPNKFTEWDPSKGLSKIKL